MSATSSTRIGPNRTARHRRHRRCMFRCSRALLISLFAVLLCWPLFGFGMYVVAAEAASTDASALSLKLPVIATILIVAMGATWKVGYEWFRLRARVRTNERHNRKLAKHLGIRLEDDEPLEYEERD